MSETPRCRSRAATKTRPGRLLVSADTGAPACRSAATLRGSDFEDFYAVYWTNSNRNHVS